MAMCLLALGSCQKNEDGGKVFMTFHATAEQSNAKTHLNNGSAIYWNEGDQIQLFSEGQWIDFLEATAPNGNEATFAGEITPIDNGRYIALYPSDDNSYAIEDGTGLSGIVANLPANQTAADGSFDPNANIMVASVLPGDSTISFRNVCAYLKIQAPWACSSIQVISNGNRKISGAFSADIASDGTPSNITPLDDRDEFTNLMGSNYIRLTGNIEANHYYYIAVLPGTLDGGFTVKFWGVNGNSNLSYNSTVSSSIQLDRKVIYPLLNFAQNEETHTVIDGAVDLGLPSATLWASRNIDVTQSNHFAANATDWGSFFKFGSNLGVTSDIIIDNAPDGNVIYNTASEICGSSWTTPTVDQFSELIACCTWTTTDDNYFIITGPNSNSIFLPFAGSISMPAQRGGFRHDEGTLSHGYWSMSTSGVDCYRLNWSPFRTSPQILLSENRYHGYPVRPVVNN